MDNPKTNPILSQHSGAKGRRPSESIRIGYTVHIRNVGDESEEDVDINNNLSSSPSLPHPKRPIRRQKSLHETSKIEKGASSSSSDFPSNDEGLPQLKEERNILPIGLSRPAQALRPATPAHPVLSCKRSLAILSPEQISTRTTRELKKTRSATALAESTGTRIEQEDTAGELTDNDLKLGFQFLN